MAARHGRLATSLAAAAGCVAAAVVVGVALEQITRLPNLSMVFLLAVLLCGMRFGMTSAIAASVLSFLAYNFFFIDPRYTFTIAEPHELLSLFIFLVVAFVTGSLAGRLSEQATATRERAEATQALFDFSRKLSGAAEARRRAVAAGQPGRRRSSRASRSSCSTEATALAIQASWPPDDRAGDVGLGGGAMGAREAGAGRARHGHAAVGALSFPPDAGRARRRSASSASIRATPTMR